jgi:hypothetical protein
MENVDDVTALEKAVSNWTSRRARHTALELTRGCVGGRSFRMIVEAVKLRWPARPISLSAIAQWAANDG